MSHIYSFLLEKLITNMFDSLKPIPNIRISWDYHPTFMLISGRAKKSFTHL